MMYAREDSNSDACDCQTKSDHEHACTRQRVPQAMNEERWVGLRDRANASSGVPEGGGAFEPWPRSRCRVEKPHLVHGLCLALQKLIWSKHTQNEPLAKQQASSWHDKKCDVSVPDCPRCVRLTDALQCGACEEEDGAKPSMVKAESDAKPSMVKAESDAKPSVVKAESEDQLSVAKGAADAKPPAAAKPLVVRTEVKDFHGVSYGGFRLSTKHLALLTLLRSLRSDEKVIIFSFFKVRHRTPSHRPCRACPTGRPSSRAPPLSMASCHLSCAAPLSCG